MLRAFVIAESAEERTATSRRLQTLFSTVENDLEYVPQIDIRPTAIQELRFQESPDLVFVAPKTLERDATILKTIKENGADVPVIALLSESNDRISAIEHYLRLGAHDTIRIDASAQDFIRRVVVAAKRSHKRSGGKLILVDSGKGGVGVTSVVAALGDSYSRSGKRTCLVDFDFETQDLSRFLQAKPYLNEVLGQLFAQRKVVSKELIEQTLVPLWNDDGCGELCVVPPAPESDEIYAGQAQIARTLTSFFEMLDSDFDVVIVDLASVRGAMLRSLYRLADEILFVVSNDPASVFASIDQIAGRSFHASAGASIRILENRILKEGLDSGLLRREMMASLDRYEVEFLDTAIPHCSKGAKWPASGESFAGLAVKKTRQSVQQLSEELLGEVEAGKRAEGGIFAMIRRRAVESKDTVALPQSQESKEPRLMLEHLRKQESPTRPAVEEPSFAVEGEDNTQLSRESGADNLTVSTPVFS